MQDRVVNQSIDRSTGRPEHTVFAVILAVSFCHLLNDMMQALLPAIYPNLKADFGLSFGQVGLVSLVYQVTAPTRACRCASYSTAAPRAAVRFPGRRAAQGAAQRCW